METVHVSRYVDKPHRFLQNSANGGECYPGTVLLDITTCGASEGSNIATVGCSFFPFDDNLLIVTSQARVTGSGFVQMWDLEGGQDEEDWIHYPGPVPTSPSYFTYSLFPTGQFSSDGNFYSAIFNNGAHQLSILQMDDSELYPVELTCRTGSSLKGRVKCCVFSHDNTRIVTISKVSKFVRNSQVDFHEICIWELVRGESIRSIWQGRCDLLCPQFGNDIQSCVLSPNSQYLAVLSHFGHLIVLDCNDFKVDSIVSRHDMCLVCLFNPQFPARLFLGYADTQCYVKDLELSEEVIEKVIVDNDVSRAYAFSPDGETLAVALLKSAEVILCNGQSLETLFRIQPQFNSAVQVYCLAFTQSCQELAVGYGAGKVRIWQLPLRLDLKHICRLVILKFVPRAEIKELPLPWNLKAYLLYSYC